MDERTVELQSKPLTFRMRESINVLRGNIQMTGYETKIISITSAWANEGKSSISFFLAQSLAKVEKRVVFIDCDIRNSKIKRTFKVMQKTTGLSEYLCGAAEIDEILYSCGESSLDIIFTGRSAPNPSELLSSKRFDELLEQLRNEYDYVIIDTPPVNVVIDASLVAGKSDSTVLIVDFIRTNKKEVRRALSQLELAGGNVMGIVLNRMFQKTGRYGYGKYSYEKYGDYNKLMSEEKAKGEQRA